MSRSAIESLSAARREPAWMTELRLDAWERYKNSSLVASGRDPLQAIRPFTPPPDAPVPSSDWPRELQHALDERGDEEGLIVQRDSTILSRSLTKEFAKKGVIFSDLDTALQTVPEMVRRYFGKLTSLENPYAALDTAFWCGGTFLYVPSYLDIQLPFHSCLWMSEPQAGIFSRTLLVVGQGSRVGFIDEGVSADWSMPGLAVAVVEAFVSEGAQVNCFQLQNWGRSVHYRREETTQVAPSGRFSSCRIDHRPATTLERAAELYPEIRAVV